MTWILSNLSTIIVSLILIAAVSAVIAHMVKNKRQGKSSCGCGCQSCAIKNSCHGSNDKNA